MGRTFWTIHTLAWLAYCVSTYLTAIPTLTAGQYGPMIAVKTLRAAIGCALSVLLFALCRALRQSGVSQGLLVLVVMLASLALGAVWLTAYWAVSEPLRAVHLSPVQWALFPKNMLDHAFVLMTCGATFLAVHEWTARLAAQRRAAEAELTAREAELRMLRYQINPHFLFNALNSVRATIPMETEAARNSVDALAGFLRYTLQASPQSLLRLEQEVDAARHYLAVEQLRFGDRLQVTIDLDPRVRHVQLPGFLLHPLVENAVKHGMASGARPLRIGIHAAPENGHIRIEVTNTLGTASPHATGANPFTPGASPFNAAGANGGDSGVGLENVRRRVPLYFQDRARFTLEQDTDLVRAVLLLDPDVVRL